MSRTFRRGVEFPHEGFVQAAIERHFRNAGYEVDCSGRADLVCRKQGEDPWHIEAKGVTTQVGLDFRTGLGQLLQGMESAKSRYGLAFPDTPTFRSLICKMSPRVVRALAIHWLIVSPDGSLVIVRPDAAPTGSEEGQLAGNAKADEKS